MCVREEDDLIIFNMDCAHCTFSQLNQEYKNSNTFSEIVIKLNGINLFD